jgi:class 3 adenylate cyclase
MSIVNVWHRIAHLGITADMTVTDAKHVRFTNIAALVAASMMLPWVPVNLLAGEIYNSLSSLVVGTSLLMVLPLNGAARHGIAAFILLAIADVQIAFGTWLFGVSSNVPLYFLLTILVPYLAFRKRHQHLAHAFALVAVAALVTLTANAEAFPAQISLMDASLFRSINLAAVAIGLVVLAAVFRGLVNDTEQALEDERARADALLLNVLPPSVAESLKREPSRTIADRYDQVTVLFADIVGFTPLSARLSADRTVELLNEIFTAFDAICDRAGVEKIRTIGDGYMAVAGAPIPRADHGQAMVRVAMAMRDYMASKPVDEPLEVRIGINSGEAVAGIVGTSRFHFDLWGDSVNVAARMESLGEPGRIQIAESTWALVHDVIPCESRGKVLVKGKGELETWFVGSECR